MLRDALAVDGCVILVLLSGFDSKAVAMLKLNYCLLLLP